MPLYLDASITTVDGNFTVNDDPIDVADGSEWPAGNFTIKVWDSSDVKILKAVIYVGTRTTNSLSDLIWDYGGHTDVDIDDGDYVALEIAAPNYPPPIWSPATPGFYDDYFQVDNSADWSTVGPQAGTVNWAYNFAARLGPYRGVHVRTTSIGAGDSAGYVKSLAGLTTGDYVQAALSYGGGPFESDWFFGIVLSAGAIGSSALVGLTWRADTNASGKIQSIEGTFDSVAGNDIDAFAPQMSSALPSHFRLVMASTTSYTAWVNYSGEDADFMQIGTVTATALTPTHGGFLCGSGITSAQIGLGHYFHSNVTP